MRNIRIIIALLVVAMSLGTTQAETLKIQSSKQGKNPWQMMMFILYNHDVDTTGLSVESPIDSILFFEILPDLEKSYHTKTDLYYGYATLGDIICSFMKSKYEGRKGEVFDYYRFRYSSRPFYSYFLQRHPNSTHAEEMRLKLDCINQSHEWSRCRIKVDRIRIYNDFSVSYCPYDGFTNIAKKNNAMREKTAAYVEQDWSEETTDEYDYEDITTYCVAPSGKFGNSAFLFGNSGILMSFSVSLEGASTHRFVLDHGQYQWVELENGRYEIKILFEDGREWWPFGSEMVNIEDGVYSFNCYDLVGAPIQSNLQPDLFFVDSKAVDEMYYQMAMRAVSELSKLSQLDHETRRKIMTTYLQKLYSKIEDKEELDQICEDYLCEENINETIGLIRDPFQTIVVSYEQQIAKPAVKM